MLSIGEMSKRANVKIPTIRYYEERGLLAASERTAGNQRRYTNDDLERLSFIRHARELGFSIEAISSLTALQDRPDRSCEAATSLAAARLCEVRAKIARLERLERELSRLSKGCDGSGVAENCYVLASLADHGLCEHEH